MRGARQPFAPTQPAVPAAEFPPRSVGAREKARPRRARRNEKEA